MACMINPGPSMMPCIVADMTTSPVLTRMSANPARLADQRLVPSGNNMAPIAVTLPSAISSRSVGFVVPIPILPSAATNKASAVPARTRRGPADGIAPMPRAPALNRPWEIATELAMTAAPCPEPATRVDAALAWNV